ncbi:hypothetical protein HMPREF3190_00024 [Umbribacter vaginalis]|nr:hypothetical protein HMPREF3190_00024 [Coriobacteriales bacterium DNF00809]
MCASNSCMDFVDKVDDMRRTSCSNSYVQFVFQIHVCSECA